MNRDHYEIKQRYLRHGKNVPPAAICGSASVEFPGALQTANASRKPEQRYLPNDAKSGTTAQFQRRRLSSPGADFGIVS